MLYPRELQAAASSCKAVVTILISRATISSAFINPYPYRSLTWVACLTWVFPLLPPSLAPSLTLSFPPADLCHRPDATLRPSYAQLRRATPSYAAPRPRYADANMIGIRIHHLLLIIIGLRTKCWLIHETRSTVTAASSQNGEWLPRRGYPLICWPAGFHTFEVDSTGAYMHLHV